MIIFKNLSKETPYQIFQEKYKDALEARQKNIEAVCISSFSKENDEVNSRFVNLKFVHKKEFIFFSNYNAPKSVEFSEHNQISLTLFWSNTNVQIRIKANIFKTNQEFNDNYFRKRDNKKNALAISSRQSRKIKSYQQIEDNYLHVLNTNDLSECPEYWGGFSFTPYYFEFWEGHESRENKRQVFNKIDGLWKQSYLQP